MKRARLVQDVIEYLIHLGSAVVLVAGYLASVDPHALLWTGIPLAAINGVLAFARAAEKWQPAVQAVAAQAPVIADTVDPAKAGLIALDALAKARPGLIADVTAEVKKLLPPAVDQSVIVQAVLNRVLGTFAAQAQNAPSTPVPPPPAQVAP